MMASYTHGSAQGFNRPDVWETRSRQPFVWTSLVVPLRVWVGKIRGGWRSEKIPHMRLRKSSISQSAPDQAWHAWASCVAIVGSYPHPMLQAKQRRLRQLWGQRHRGLRSVAGQFQGLLARHGTNLAARPDYRPHRHERALRTGELPLGADVGTGSKSSPRFRMAWHATARCCNGEVRP